MQQSYITTLLLLLFLLPLSLLAQKNQHDRCYFHHRREHNLKKHPELKQERAELEKFTQKWITENRFSQKSDGVVTIPVVIHVVWRNSVENISDEQIASQIAILNEDFRLKNSIANVPNEFRALIADIEVEFCLASYDPNNRETNGITRTQTTINEIGIKPEVNGRFPIYFDDLGGKGSWDTDKYLNIWVCELDEDGDLLGYASSPSTAPYPEDGVVIDYRYFGDIGTATNSFPNQLGRTATHEVGHYFNLEHVWGPGGGGCAVDDFVDDTPTQETYYFGCPKHPQVSCNTNDMFMNFMDYVNDDCMAMFSNGQKLRMLAALNGPRNGLLNSNGCGSAGIPVKVKMNLEGAWNNSTQKMNTKLRAKNLLPKLQPYHVYPWTYYGGEEVEDTSAFPMNVVDWVLVEMRDSVDPNTLISIRAGLLLDDGTVVDVDGKSDLTFRHLKANDYYYIVVRHRNHLAVISQGRAKVPNPFPYDFTRVEKVQQGDMQLANISNGVYGLHAGDVDGNGAITTNDFNQYIKDLSNFNNYFSGDINLDKSVTVKDFNLFRPNSSLIGVSQIR